MSGIPVAEFHSFLIFMGSCRVKVHIDITDLEVEGGYCPDLEYVPGEKVYGDYGDDEGTIIDWDALKAFPTIEEAAMAQYNLGASFSEMSETAGYDQ